MPVNSKITIGNVEVYHDLVWPCQDDKKRMVFVHEHRDETYHWTVSEYHPQAGVVGVGRYASLRTAIIKAQQEAGIYDRNTQA